MNTSNFDPRQFRQALGAFTTGVTIVTTRGQDGQDYGLTANSFNSVSIDPPLVLWSINKDSSSAQAFTEGSHFAVHILATDQEALSNRFAKSASDKFQALELQRGPCDVPLLDGCSARFQCKTTYQYEGGDHIILVGEVLAFDRFDKDPLVFHGGGYRRLLPAEAPGQEHASIDENGLGSLLGRAPEALSFKEAQQLKSLIGRLIQHTGAELPAYWRTDNAWHNSHLWQQLDGAPAAR